MAGGLAGIEVPIVGSDSVKWTELSFPSSPAAAAADSDLLVPALTGDFASCSAVGDPPTYLSWSQYSHLLLGISRFFGR